MRLILLLCIFIMISCNTEFSSKSEVEIIELTDFETIVALEKAENENNIISTPTILRYELNSNLFVFDDRIGKVLELDSSGRIIMEYGRRGAGPGEFLSVNNIFLTNDYVYIIDEIQLFIHKFDRKGRLSSTFDYGAIINTGSAPPPPMSSGIQAKVIINQPIVTLNGYILLSSVKSGQNVLSIYEKYSWEGIRMSHIGSIPDGSTFVFDPVAYRASINNREIPANYKPYAFPINDLSNEDEIFLVYSAIPMIAKYDLNGNRLWENEIKQPSEIESIENHYYERMDRLSNTSTMVLKKYVNGVSTLDGDLFLISNPETNGSLWIHQFNSSGTLIKRYKLISKDVVLLPIFDIDINTQRIFVITDMSDIRVYPF